MNHSIRRLVLACVAFVGCGSSLQVGLASAPVLGGDTPESRVHDVIANGHDACERSGFPPGGVLRGQIPPCTRDKSIARAVPWLRGAPSRQSSSGPRTGPCHIGPRLTAAAGLAAFVSSSGETPECDVPVRAVAPHRRRLDLGDRAGLGLTMPPFPTHDAACGAVSDRHRPTFAVDKLSLLRGPRGTDTSVELMDPLSLFRDCRYGSHSVSE